MAKVIKAETVKIEKPVFIYYRLNDTDQPEVFIFKEIKHVSSKIDKRM